MADLPNVFRGAAASDGECADASPSSTPGPKFGRYGGLSARPQLRATLQNRADDTIDAVHVGRHAAHGGASRSPGAFRPCGARQRREGKEALDVFAVQPGNLDLNAADPAPLLEEVPEIKHANQENLVDAKAGRLLGMPTPADSVPRGSCRSGSARLTVRPVLGVDQGTKSGEHRGAAGAQRELE
jgi:hypothetical protein